MAHDSNNRIFFLDMLRALAVLLMVQGHTIDAFLADQYRSYDSTIYNIWFTIRGFTAPIFMFSSGVAFTYLLRINKTPFFRNPRAVKGFYRFIVLVLVGYLLRFPTYKIIDFSEVTYQQWITFFTVDALHLIGFGLLFILSLSYIADKIKVGDTLLYLVGALFFFVVFNFTEKINWANYMPIPFAAYFYQKTGSLFPLFPWTGYVLFGAALGSYLAKNPGVFTTKKFSWQLFSIGLTALLAAMVVSYYQNNILKEKIFWTDNSFVILLRISVVMILSSLMSFISLSIKQIPDFVKQIGSHTLLIYVVHLIILYGSAWIPGITLLYYRSFDISISIMNATMMIILMLSMVTVIEKYKSLQRKKIELVKV